MCNVHVTFVNMFNSSHTMLLKFVRKIMVLISFLNFDMSLARFSIYKRKYTLLNHQAELNLVDCFKTELVKYISQLFIF